MEILSIVCEQSGKELGTMPRAEAIEKQAWCQSTNVFVLNSKGQVLCHQRSMKKERWPGRWSTHLGGHVGVGETLHGNAHKELEEESGISVPAEKVIAWRTAKLSECRLWVGEFVTMHDAEIHELVPQPGEVDRFAWHTPEEILKLAKENPDQWLAGMYDFQTEYQCMRAALTAAHASGSINVPDEIRRWIPGRIRFA